MKPRGLSPSVSFILFIVILLQLSICSTLFASESTSFTSVDITDPVYQILESAQIRGLIERLPSSKPYSQATIVKALEELSSSREISKNDRTIISSELDRLTGKDKEHSSIFQTGSISSKDKSLWATMGADVTSLSGLAISTDSTDFGTTDFLNLYLTGTWSQEEEPLLSYTFDMGFGAVSIAGQSYTGAKLKVLEQRAFAPYSYTPNWEGYSYSLLDPFNNVTGDEGVYIAFSMDPEISTQLFDDHLRLEFSRTSRNWGLGEDSLLLSEMAPPFVSLAATAKIFPWMDYSVLTGTLENYGDSSASSALQTMVTIKSVDVRPFDWLYLGVHEAVVWPKRFELGYINPLIFSSLYQGQIGNYDNILGGLSLGLSIPRYADFYGTFMIDEFSPTSFSDMFERVRNFFSYQVGMKAALPGSAFGTMTAQYTKIEPFTYTHPATAVPWVDAVNPDTVIIPEGTELDEDVLLQIINNGKVYESFVSNGYGIASKLPPNTDELLLKAESYITPAIELTGSYQMIRHGEYGGDYNAPLDSYSNPDVADSNGILPDGMEYPDWLGGDDTSVSNLRKSFLRDGDYTWFHIFTLGGEINLRELADLPLKVKISDALVYQFQTDENVELIADSDRFTNYLTLSVTAWRL